MVVLWECQECDRAMGIAVGRPVGSAVVRSGVRRRFRESYRHLRHAVMPAYMLFIARPGSSAASTAEITREMEHLLREASLWRAEE
jgi:ribonuclease P protein component